jgi:putative transposase
VKKSSQIQPVGATAVPERVSVAMTEIAENVHEGPSHGPSRAPGI